MKEKYVWRPTAPEIWSAQAADASVLARIKLTASDKRYQAQLSGWEGPLGNFDSRAAAQEFSDPFLKAALRTRAELAQNPVTYAYNATGRKNIGNCCLRAASNALGVDYEILRVAADKFVNTRRARRKNVENGLKLYSAWAFYQKLGLSCMEYETSRGIRIDRLPHNHNFILLVHVIRHMTALVRGEINDTFRPHLTGTRMRAVRICWRVPENYKFDPARLND